MAMKGLPLLQGRAATRLAVVALAVLCFLVGHSLRCGGFREQLTTITSRDISVPSLSLIRAMVTTTAPRGTESFRATRKRLLKLNVKKVHMHGDNFVPSLSSKRAMVTTTAPQGTGDPRFTEKFIRRAMSASSPVCLQEDPQRLRAAYLKIVPKHHDASRDGAIRATQKRRQEIMAEACVRNNRSTQLSSLTPAERRMTLRHIVVNDMTRMLYCFIPKTSCSNWKQIFKTLQERDAWPGCFPLEHKRDVITLDMFSEKEIDIRLKTYYKFVFGREPLQRLYSAYRDKFQRKTVPKSFFHEFFGRRIAFAYRSQSSGKYNSSSNNYTGDDVTWKEFAQFIADRNRNPNMMDDHWMRLENLCQPCKIKYDFIGHYEELSEESNYIMRDRNIHHRVVFPPRQGWYSAKKLSKASHLYRLNPRLRASLLDVYRESYELFDYDKPPIFEP